MTQLLALENVSKKFPLGRGQFLQALNNVSLAVHSGEVLGIVGESGSGKSTAARIALRLLSQDAGRVLWGELDVTGLREKALRPLRPHIQMVFQDPYASLNPRMTIGDALREPLLIHRSGSSSSDQWRGVRTMLDQVGMPDSTISKYPHEFSGGQRQRICIARALMLSPKLLILDEAVSALDVSIQAQILALLLALKQELNLAYFFITHDLEVIRLIADRVVVMQNGAIVEKGDTAALFDSPQMPYTQRLLASRPAYVAQEKE